MAEGTASSDAITKNQLDTAQGANKSYADTKLSLTYTGGVMQGNLNMYNNRIYNLAKPNGDDQPTTKNYTDTYFLKLNGDNAMAGPLNMSNNKITRLANPTANGDAINKSWSESNFLKLIGETLSGNLSILTINMGDVNNNLY